MEVILLEKVDNLGNLGERVKVKSGYGRNFLLPSGKAAPATAENIEIFEKRRAELEKAAAAATAEAEARRGSIENLNLTITAKAGDEGKLFGSIGNFDIAEAAVAAGVTIEKKEIRMPEGPLRMVGDYEVEVHLHTDVNVNIKVSIVAEESSSE
jgi:large subunit ribosomal protein L9